MQFGVGAGEEREERMPTEAIWVVVAWDISGQGIGTPPYFALSSRNPHVPARKRTSPRAGETRARACPPRYSSVCAAPPGLTTARPRASAARRSGQSAVSGSHCAINSARAFASAGQPMPASSSPRTRHVAARTVGDAVKRATAAPVPPAASRAARNASPAADETMTTGAVMLSDFHRGCTPMRESGSPRVFTMMTIAAPAAFACLAFVKKSHVPRTTRSAAPRAESTKSSASGEQSSGGDAAMSLGGAAAPPSRAVGTLVPNSAIKYS